MARPFAYHLFLHDVTACTEPVQAEEPRLAWKFAGDLTTDRSRLRSDASHFIGGRKREKESWKDSHIWFVVL